MSADEERKSSKGSHRSRSSDESLNDRSRLEINSPSKPPGLGKGLSHSQHEEGDIF